ncbi:putative Ran binding domain, PH-like domain superfamily, nuclear pore complex, NUP2/50/61 [Helianthus annuus]|uniref:Putative PH domain-like, Nuclear pore complex, NUP2/50/61 n=1 Tax=Helianthus annuus TaxID=4232 RepID=A0A251UVS7_HELAN|nr:nuclear pore complex protein NUP50B [Helianthus annuus]XP_022033681.1 nuclear pore complex protein NUP50B [Helianthus annuus]KAF5808075.1 putative Ran binding domain, PH-like domain superfamily, nuclear pore complex, NUP2/50/61 [Helianthus annuus]KAJ0595258.1 putative Ran binding domain, PH-like domain superfamily, nuclear pore complex, NUP2/50/61 [Helianthus annuus]KAJ0755937.1 putative Ran binding domain, PH-like domain superfamily, nuclear pore complex, NUP2/50/61 [Helianthus annuus]KAJ0
MGDAENTFPSSRKRAAGRELSRENPGLDDEEEFPDQETGTFKRASDDVLANRRIVKVKRGQTSSTASAPSSNPFAAIRLVPPANSQEIVNHDSEKLVVGNDENTPAAEEEKNGNADKLERNDGYTPASKEETNGNEDKLEGNDGNTPASKEETNGNEDKLEGNVGNTPALEEKNCENKDTLDKNDGNTPVSGNENVESKVVGNDEGTPAAEKEQNEIKQKLEANDENTPGARKKENLGNDENTPAAGSVNSFKQLSSSQNAFSGLVGTGFSGSSFSFGSISKSDLPIFPSFSFGTNGNSYLFGNTDKKIEGTKTTPSFKQEVQIETGEENEKAVFTAESVLFEFVDGGWKERGKGELKVNVLTSGTRKARLVMRARGNYRLILNASIFPDMKLTNMEKKGITFACVNSTSEGQNGLSTFALKFKDASLVDEFRSVVMAHKGNFTPAVDLKTHEISPKAPEQ